MTLLTPSSQTQSDGVRNLLSAVTSINELLLAPSVSNELFVGVARVIADKFNYPLCAILLFDEKFEHIELAGANHTIKPAERGPLHRKFDIEHLSQSPWLHSVLEGILYTTTYPMEVLEEFLPKSRSAALLRMFDIKSGIAVPLI